MDITSLNELRIVLDTAGQIAIAIALMLIMFGIALGLRVADFTCLLQRRVQFIAGVLTQLVGLPLITLALVKLIAPPPALALGMFVVACCPGGAVSNLFTYLARGDTAYSVSLTAVSSALAAFLTPASILFWSGIYRPTSTLLQTIDFNAVAFLAQTTMLLALPLVLGMILGARAPDVAMRVRRSITLAGSLVLAGAIVYGSIKFFALLAPALPLIGMLTIAHNAVAFTTGAVAGLALRANRATRRALTFEIGIQNSGLAIVILLAQFDGLGGAAAIAVLWGIWHLVAGGFLVMLFCYLDQRRVKCGL
ncbi:MAG: bile acid:sodium symporter family protein [Gammaproteobacteria bacterium]|nr:bile acid:sodium symporter family protein [Gammaproteobacteria bacterium]MDH5302480.1 bile acid:sodium symporter family protein [Gammaproteobacteria bacterium]MDH5321362.1 bile acid:sodium symporter family protein [Gammaproteobacteria bacterium]